MLPKFNQPKGSTIGVLKDGRTVQEAIDSLDSKTVGITLQSLGSPCDGVGDDTPYLVSALSAGVRDLWLPKGTYSFTLNTVKLPSGTTVRMAKGAVIKASPQTVSGGSDGSHAVFNVEGTAGNVVSDVVIDGGQFVSADDTIVAVAVRSYASGVTVSNIKCAQMRAVAVADNARFYEDSTAETRPSSVFVLNARGSYIGATKTQSAFVLVRYGEYVQVIGGRASGYFYGGMCWGGDSDPAKQGAVANERKARHIVFSEFHCNVLQAGVWASMAHNLLIANCTAVSMRDPNDVGFDLEGCQLSKVRGCHAENFHNGNYATFWLGTAVSFEGNTSVVSDGKSRHARFFNAAQSIESSEIIFTNNILDTKGGYVSSVGQQGAVHNLLFKDNILRNTLIGLNANNNGYIEIVNNTLRFTQIPTVWANNAGYMAAVFVGNTHGDGGGCTISGNTFENSTTWPTGSCAIGVLQTGSNRAVTTDLIGNVVRTQGFDNDFIVEHNGSNAAYYHRFNVRDMRMWSGKYVTKPSAGGRYPELRMVGCRDNVGFPFPQVPIATCYYKAGQVFTLAAPTAAKRGQYNTKDGLGSEDLGWVDFT